MLMQHLELCLLRGQPQGEPKPCPASYKLTRHLHWMAGRQMQKGRALTTDATADLEGKIIQRLNAICSTWYGVY